MNRGPNGRRRECSCGRQKLVRIISNPVKPRVLCCLKRRKLTRKRIAHGRASAPASDLARLLDKTGGERVMRSIAPQIGCPRRSGYEISAAKQRGTAALRACSLLKIFQIARNPG